MIRAALVALLVSGFASAESLDTYVKREFTPEVKACRQISFWQDRDECLAKLLDAENVDKSKRAKNETQCHNLTEKQAKKDAAISGSNYGTWQLLCELAKANPDKYPPLRQ